MVESILIKDASWIVTQNPKREILKNNSIYIEGNKIVEIGKLKTKADITIDGTNKIVIPGLVNAHTHVAMTLFRGVADDLPLMEWLKNYIWPMEAKLKPKDVYYGALLGCLEMIKTGTTCFCDMYLHMKNIANAVLNSGIRGALSPLILETLPENLTGLKVAKDFLQFTKKIKTDRITPWLGPHSTYGCSASLLKKVREFSKREGLRINIHVSESKKEISEVKQKHRKTPIEFLNDLDFLSPDVTAAHCVYPIKNEIKILREKNVKVVHNPVSNMKLASGIAPIPEMLENNICVGLGTDGASSNNSLDMFQEMKFAALLHKVNKLDPTVIPAEKVFEFATIDGAKALGLENQVGSLEVGKKADVVIMDIKKPHITPISSEHSIISHLVYTITGNDVETVIADGKVLMKDGKVLILNEEKIYSDTNKLVSSLLA